MKNPNLNQSLHASDMSFDFDKSRPKEQKEDSFEIIDPYFEGSSPF
jgi:hypothetical protein